MNKSLKNLLILLPILSGGVLTSCNKNNRKEKEEPQKNFIVDMTKENYSIVIPTNSKKGIKFAASEMSSLYKEATGISLQIFEENQLGSNFNGNVISLGSTSLYKTTISKMTNAPTLSKEALNDDGFYIYTSDENIFINGANERGILFGTYEFLENTLGIKYLTYDYTYVPSLTEVNLYSYDKVYVPAFKQRGLLNNGVYSQNVIYSGRMRFNTDFSPLTQLEDDNDWMPFAAKGSHTSLEILPVSKYSEFDINTGTYKINDDYLEVFCHYGSGDHVEQQEFFNGLTDLCWTNGVTYNQDSELSTLNLLLEALKGYIIANPTKNYIMVGQSDVINGCACDHCAESNAKYKGSGTLIRFINKLADELNKWIDEKNQKENFNHEHINLCMFAYMYSEEAPLDSNGNLLDSSCKPNDNVYIKFAPLSSYFIYSITDSRQIQTVTKNFEDWKKVASGHLTTWTYACAFNNYFWYYPSVECMQQLLREQYEAGVLYTFHQSIYNEANPFEQHLEAYVYSKLCWNLNLNVRDLEKEFVKYYFGEDALEDIMKFIDLINAHYSYLESKSIAMYTTNVCSPADWPFQVTNSLVKCFEDAIKKTKANDKLPAKTKNKLIKNLERGSLTPKYMRFTTFSGTSTALNAEFISDWFVLAEKYGVKYYAEGVDTTLQNLKERYGL